MDYTDLYSYVTVNITRLTFDVDKLFDRQLLSIHGIRSILGDVLFNQSSLVDRSRH